MELVNPLFKKEQDVTKPLKEHYFRINPTFNGGEALTLKTEFFRGDNPSEVDYIQRLTLQSYANNVTLSLCGAVLTPELLRELADSLEMARNEAKIASLERNGTL
jgi:hypothetical protein